MSLLDKFNSVEVTADTRISEQDRKFCQAQKSAYDHARQSLKVMAEQATTILNAQKEILIPVENEVYSTYLGDFQPSKYSDTLKRSHALFIRKLFQHFRSKYGVTIEEHDAEEALLPKEPRDRGWSYNKEELAAYNNALEELILDYPAVLDQIFIQLGGYSFQDKAVQELKEASRKAGWNDYNGTKRFEQKKAVISFSGYACSFDSWHEEYYHGEHQIKFPDSTKNVVRAILYFEYGSIKNGYTPLDVLLGYDWTTKETELSVYMEKLKSVKCFKNGRVDFRFNSEAYAREFVEDYLGTEL